MIAAKGAGKFSCASKVKIVNHMLACQGALNFTLWTGVEAPLQVMEDKLREEFAEG